MTESAPYSAIAPVYDGMMEHVDYKQWAGYIDRLFQVHRLQIASICELACGTGSLAVELADIGYRMTCSDVSTEMIAQASSKVRPNLQLKFNVADMTEYRSTESFDAVLCLYDSVNYLTDEVAFRKLFDTVWKLLTYGGVFIFDVCTERNSLQHFENRYEYDRTHHYRRKSYYLPQDRIQVNEVVVTSKGQTFVEKHLQRIYRLSYVDTVIKTTGFKILATYEDLSFRAGSEQSDRVHYVLLKPTEAR